MKTRPRFVTGLMAFLCAAALFNPVVAQDTLVIVPEHPGGGGPAPVAEHLAGDVEVGDGRGGQRG